MNANSSSFADLVEKAGVAIVVLAVDPSVETFASIARPALLAEAVKFIPDKFAPFTVTVWLAGLNVNPDLEGVTV